MVSSTRESQRGRGGEFLLSRFDQTVKRCLAIPTSITVVPEQHFVSRKTRPKFSLLPPQFQTSSLRLSPRRLMRLV